MTSFLRALKLRNDNGDCIEYNRLITVLKTNDLSELEVCDSVTAIVFLHLLRVQNYQICQHRATKMVCHLPEHQERLSIFKELCFSVGKNPTRRTKNFF